LASVPSRRFHVERRVAAASSEQLETWIGRVLSAATLTELLAD
jgi:hypothetical protein